MPCDPLPIGYLTGDRFEIREVLGQGGFGIAYLAFDTAREDEVVVKELAPQGSRRRPGGVLELDAGVSSPGILRQRFLEEARLLSKVNNRGVLPMRASYSENGTAYYVTEYVPKSETLERILLREGRLDVDGALDIFFGLLDVIQAVHDKGILHRDIKPSNVLVTSRGLVILIDFGAAREFHADSASTHTVMFTPGYAPPEQMSERAKRGPATDLYALAATLYHMLVGMPPEDAGARVAGAKFGSLLEMRPDVDPIVAMAIERTLSLKYAERPQSAEELRTLLASPEEFDREAGVQELDALLLKSRTFTFAKRQCPSCDGILTEVRPLRRNACPVCRKGMIRRRRIEEKLCPVCKVGGLTQRENGNPLLICPTCAEGQLRYRRKTLLNKQQIASCTSCQSSFEWDGAELGHSKSEEKLPAEDWRIRSGRAQKVWTCGSCPAQFDVMPDGRLLQVVPKPTGRYRALYPEEWARVAAGLLPGAGNAECDACGADYFWEDDRITLLDAFSDPNGFAAEYLGRLIGIEDSRWFAVGKSSPAPGLVCDHCGMEFDLGGSAQQPGDPPQRAVEFLKLVRSPDKALVRQEGEYRRLEDWHRLGRDVPTKDREPELEDHLERAIRQAYWDGELGLDSQNRVSWRSPAIRAADGAKGSMQVIENEIVFSSLFRKWRAQVRAVAGCAGSEAQLSIRLTDEEDWNTFEVEPIDLTLRLKSGDRRLRLSARDLAARIDRLRSEEV